MNESLSELYDTLTKIDKRITTLNKDTNFVENKTSTIESNRAEKYYSLNSELTELKNALQIINDDLKECINYMNRIGRDLKTVVKKDQFDEVSSKVDEIRFEEFVTYNDLKKGV